MTSYGYALIYSGLRENEQALTWLRKAVEERSHWLVWIRVDPRFDTLRGEPPFSNSYGLCFQAIDVDQIACLPTHAKVTPAFRRLIPLGSRAIEKTRVFGTKLMDIPATRLSIARWA